ncbi:MAG: four helix bundle protein [Candidatus Marinimicrobia bacterium]|nr:four helix bundle protein [Candidatus Neomarinimicrobiota bacterium]
MHLYSFEKLDMWKDIRNFVNEIYEISDNFPYSEYKGLRDQIRRASVSVSSNIAEGSGRLSFKEQARFIQIAYSSLLEVLSQLMVAYDRKYINESTYQKGRRLIENLSPRISAYRKYLLQNVKKTTTSDSNLKNIHISTKN